MTGDRPCSVGRAQKYIASVGLDGIVCRYRRDRTIRIIIGATPVRFRVERDDARIVVAGPACYVFRVPNLFYPQQLSPMGRN
jgi:hypothetical protein